MVSFSSGSGVGRFHPSSVAFAGRHPKGHGGLKPLPQPIQSGDAFADMIAMAEALDSDSDVAGDSLTDSFCSTTSTLSRSTSSSSRSAARNLRNVKPDDVRQVLSWLGFAERGQKGSHHQLVSPNLKRAVTVPDHGSAKHTISSGTMNSILNQVEEILDEEQAGLMDGDAWIGIDKETIRAWVNDPKGNRQEIQTVGRNFPQVNLKRSGFH